MLSHYFHSPGAIKLARQVQTTEDRVHESAAAGAGASVQAEQVPVATEALRGGDVPHADRNPGNLHLGVTARQKKQQPKTNFICQCSLVKN